MRKKRKRATSVLVDGVVHAISITKQAFDDVTRGATGEAWPEYLLPRRMTRAQRKAKKAKLLKDRTHPLVQLACELWYTWRSAPRTHAAVTCMTCLVSLAEMGR